MHLVVAADDVFHTHQQPVWRDRSDSLIMAALPEHHHYEQVWARRDADLFEVCCIPFFVHNLALGDVVRTEARAGRTHLITEVVRPSGHWTFRLWLRKSNEDRMTVESEFVLLGALSEWASEHLLALDAGGAALAQVIADALAQGERAGRWMYETGRT